MRRVAAILLLTAWLAGVAPAPAGAHICPVTAQVPVNQRETVTVAVVVEAVPIPDVQIDVPSALRLDDVHPPSDWTAAKDGQTIRLHGPAFTPFTCDYLSITVTPTVRGVYGIRVLQRDAQGVLRGDSMPNAALPPDPTFVTTVYAGVNPPSASKGGGVSVVTIAGIALIGGGVIAVGVLVRRSRRDRRIDERVEEFKKQVRDRGA